MASWMVSVIAAKPTKKPMMKKTMPIAKISHPSYVFKADDLNLCHDTHAAGKDANYCTTEKREEGNEVPWDLIDLGKALVAGEVACPCLHRERDNASDENGQYEQQVNGNELLSKRGGRWADQWWRIPGRA